MPLWDLPQRKTDFTPDALLALRPVGAAALNATEVAGGTPRLIYGGANLNFDIAYIANAYTGHVSGTAFWAIVVEVSDAAAGTYVEVGRANLTGVAIKGRIAVHSSVVLAAGTNMNYIRTRAVKTGTPGDLTYTSFVTQSLG